MPHMSLLYGIDDMKKRDDICKSISVSPENFLCDRISIYLSDPDVSKWKLEAEVPFSS